MDSFTSDWCDLLTSHNLGKAFIGELCDLLARHNVSITSQGVLTSGDRKIYVDAQDLPTRKPYFDIIEDNPQT